MLPPILREIDPLSFFEVGNLLDQALRMRDDGSATFLLRAGQRLLQALEVPILTQIRLRNIMEMTFDGMERASQQKRFEKLRGVYPDVAAFCDPARLDGYENVILPLPVDTVYQLRLVELMLYFRQEKQRERLIPMTIFQYSEWEENARQAHRDYIARKIKPEEFLRRKGANTWVIQELCNIQEPSDKDIFAAIYLSNKTITKFLDPAARIAPAVFFQPHFPNIVYNLKVDRKGRTALQSEVYDKTVSSPIFRGFKYIKTFTPMRRFTTSHGTTVKFMYNSALEDAEKRKKGERKGKAVTVVPDAVTQRVLNRSSMIDW